MNSNPQIHLNKYNEEGFEIAFKKAGIAVLIENVNRSVTFVNQVFCNLFGIKLMPTSLINSSIVDNAKGFSMHFEKSEAFQQSLLNIQKISFENEEWLLRNGKIILRSFTPYFIKNELKGFVWIYEEKNQTSNLPIPPLQLPYGDILDSIPHEISLFNNENKIEFVNQFYIPSISKRKWALGKTLEQYFSYENLHLEIAHKRMKYIDKVWKEKKSSSYDESTLTVSLNKEHFTRNFIPILNDQKEIHFVLELGTNITPIKTLEEKFINATEHFFAILNNCSDLILHTNDELKLKYLNNSFNQFLGEKAKASIHDIFSLKQYELYKKIFSVLLGDHSDKSGKIELTNKEGKEKLFKYNLQPNFNVEDGNKGILITLNDITAQEQHENQLLQLVKREKELNELKTAFVNMVSHELRTPLTVISSSAEILDLMLEVGKPKEEIGIYTKQIIDEVEKMTAFMQDLLMVSKIEAGKIDLNPSDTNINFFIEKLISENFSPWNDGRKCNFIFKRAPQNANIDKKMIGHVLQNLLQNAFKYSSGKSAPNVRVAYSNSYFTISIVDEGIGIPDKDKSQLFTSFFRASNTANISGTGIGLIVVKYFTEQHKGNVFVKSKTNKGSIFTIKLPYNL